MTTALKDEADIRQLVNDWLTATKRGDVQAVLTLMTEDMVFLIPGQPPMDKAGFKAAMSAMPASAEGKPFMDGTSEIKDLQVVGEVAYMWTQLKVVITPPQANLTITRAGHTLTVLRKEQGMWKIARDANLLVTLTSSA